MSFSAQRLCKAAPAALFVLLVAASPASAATPQTPETDLSPACLLARFASPARAFDDRDLRLAMPLNGCAASPKILTRLLPSEVQSSFVEVDSRYVNGDLSVRPLMGVLGFGLKVVGRF